jgi:hypothetical protein
VTNLWIKAALALNNLNSPVQFSIKKFLKEPISIPSLIGLMQVKFMDQIKKLLMVSGILPRESLKLQLVTYFQRTKTGIF